MSMQCNVNNRLTPLEVRNMTLEEEDIEAVEDMKDMEDTEAKEEVEEALAEVENRSYSITVASRVTLHEIVR